MMKVDEKFEIVDIDLTFLKLKDEKPLVLDKYFDVILLPSLHDSTAFHVGALDIYDYFKKSLGEDKVEIFALDDEYLEIALHSRALWIGGFLVSSVILPIFINLLSTYIFNELKAVKGDEVNFSIVVDKSDNHQNIMISYKGDAENVQSILDTIVEIDNNGKTGHKTSK